MTLSIIVCTYNPGMGRLEAALRGLGCQTLAISDWELIVVDNASVPPVSKEWCEERAGRSVTFVSEATPGLTHARLAGIKESASDLLIFCDDDNVLAPDYLELAQRLMNKHMQVGVAGGKSLPFYLSEPPPWFRDDLAPLGCRDFGNVARVVSGRDFQLKHRYPEYSPIGAGMIFRKSSMNAWLKTAGNSRISDRKGKSLSSAGDCDMVLHALEAGYDAAYWPELVLEHLMPAERLTKAYLGALSRAAYRDFVRVLAIHGVCPWPPIPAWTVRLRTVKAWASCKAWRGPVNWIHWQGSIGQFEGRSLINR